MSRAKGTAMTQDYMSQHDFEGHDTADARPIGLIMVLCVIAAAVLVLLHPAGSGHDAATVIEGLAADRMMDGLVHGGMVVVMGILTLCLAVACVRLNIHRGVVMAGFAAYIIGYLGFSGALITDGLILPAIATRFVPIDPATLPVARGLLIFAGAAIGFLMTFGLSFFALGTVAWGYAFLRSRGTRSAGYVGLLLGFAALVLLGLMQAGMFGDPHVLIAVIALLLLWVLVLAIVLIRRAV